MRLHRVSPSRSGVYAVRPLRYAPTKAWTLQTDDAIRSTPLVVDQLVVVGSDDETIRGVDLATGTQRWHYPAGGSVRSSPASDGELVFVGCDASRLLALDVATGQKRWEFLAGAAIEDAPLLLDGLVLVASADRRLYALHAKTGELVWKVDVGSRNVQNVAAYNGSLMLASNDYVLMLDPPTGKMRRSLQAPGAEEITTGVLPTAKGLVIGTFDGHLHLMDPETGAARWTFRANSSFLAPPAVTDDTVYIGNRDFNLYAISLYDGRERWRHTSQDAIECAPVLAEDVLVFDTGAFTDPVLHGLDRLTGAPIWNHPDEADILTFALLDDAALYTTEDGRLVMLR